MSINTRVGSGQLFVRFVTVGLTALFVSIISLKFTNIFGVYTTLILGLCIFIINLVSVLGYTLAVIKSPQVLAETDAPDLAYYLGFCLTVGALSVTFIIDTMLDQFALQQTDLIKSSLVQFGVGLTATLIGLCAKIYLSSEQSSESLEPEELYRNFRVEISAFEKEMRLITDSYTRTVEDNISKLNNSVSKLDASISGTFISFDKLRDVVNKSNLLITENISHDNISKPINDFIKSISAITKVTKEFASEGKVAIDGFKDISSSMVSMKSNIETTDASIKSLQASTVLLSNSAQNLVESNDNIKLSNQSLSTDITGFSSTVKLATQSAGEFLSTLKIAGERISLTSQEFSELNNKTQLGVAGFSLLIDGFKDISSSMVSMKSNIETTDASIKSLQASTVLLSNSAQNLVESNDNIKLSNQSLSTDITGFSSTVKLATQSAGEFLSTLKIAGERISLTSQEFSELNNKTQLGVAGFSLFFEKMNSIVISLTQFGNQLTALENLLIKNNSDLKFSNESSRTFISDVDNFQKVIKNISSELTTFELKLNRINNAN